jgi:hypothetical protein
LGLVKLNWKMWAIIPAIAAVGAGCSGINVTKSVSPATFLLPGLLKADPPKADPDRDLPVEESVTQVAQSQ